MGFLMAGFWGGYGILTCFSRSNGYYDKPFELWLPLVIGQRRFEGFDHIASQKFFRSPETSKNTRFSSLGAYLVYSPMQRTFAFWNFFFVKNLRFLHYLHFYVSYDNTFFTDVYSRVKRRFYTPRTFQLDVFSQL